jgi:pyruvate-ferredoxin/flavodoxin oxidoreductase
MQNQKAAVDVGQWPLYRYNPARAETGDNPFSLDSRKPRGPVQKYLYMENRFKMLTKSKPEVARQLFEAAQDDVDTRWAMYEYLASRSFEPENGHTAQVTDGAGEDQ